MATAGRGNYRFQSTWIARAIPWNHQTAAADGPGETIWKDWLFEAAGGAQSYTLVADSGSFPWTGTAAGLRASRKIDATSGSFAWTGTAATLRAARKLVATTGAFAFTGTAASLLVSRRLVAETGNFPWTGTAAGLLTSRRLVAESGSFIWTGTDANFLRSLRLDAESGNFAWNGTDATLVKSFVFVAEEGNFAWTGTPVTFVKSSRLVAESGSFAFTGTAAGLYAGRVLVATTGAFPWTGTDASFDVEAPEVETPYERTHFVLAQIRRIAVYVGALRMITLAASTRRTVLQAQERRVAPLMSSRITYVTERDILRELEGFMFAMPNKSPGELLDYVIDWSQLFESGEIISTSQWVVSVGITQATPAPSNTTTTTKIYLSGGTDEASYILRNTIVTSASRTFVRSFSLRVNEDE